MSGSSRRAKPRCCSTVQLSGRLRADLELADAGDEALASRLTYFSAAVNGDTVTQTLAEPFGNGRHALARPVKPRGIRYTAFTNTRESSIRRWPRRCFNVLGVGSGKHVLDPFCGSGTTLVECAHADIMGYGMDLNPFAVLPSQRQTARIGHAHPRTTSQVPDAVGAPGLPTIRSQNFPADTRTAYLQSWFRPDILSVIETIRTSVEDSNGAPCTDFPSHCERPSTRLFRPRSQGSAHPPAKDAASEHPVRRCLQGVLHQVPRPSRCIADDSRHGHPPGQSRTGGYDRSFAYGGNRSTQPLPARRMRWLYPTSTPSDCP